MMNCLMRMDMLLHLTFFKCYYCNCMYLVKIKTKHQKFHSVRCAATNLSECVMTPPRVRFEISYFTFRTCEIVIIVYTCFVIKNAIFVIL